MNSARLDRAIDQDTVRRAIELAVRAPSIHNTQPWRWSLGERGVHLYADPNRWLPATDAEGRDLLLSCGAALHHPRIALAASAIGATVHRLPNPVDPDHLAALELFSGRSGDADSRLVLGATSDDRLCQLRAGEALSAVLLMATASGLATCPLSQPLEIGSTRRYLRDQVLDGICPQIIIRVGWAPSAPALPATPRRRVAEVIDPLPR